MRQGTTDSIHLTPDSDIQSLDDDGETELEPATVYDAHVMEQIDSCAQEQEWAAGDGDAE